MSAREDALRAVAEIRVLAGGLPPGKYRRIYNLCARIALYIKKSSVTVKMKKI